MYKAHHWALYHMWFQNKSELYIYFYIYMIWWVDFNTRFHLQVAPSTPNRMANPASLPLGKKNTIHQVTIMLATSKNVLFPGNNHLLTTGADDPSL